VVTATATDPYTEVVLRKEHRLWTLIATSEDGTVTTTYRVRLTPR
jgi:hypothetical protein